MGRVLNRALAWNGPLVTLLGLALALTAGLLLARLTPLGGALFVVLAVVGVATVIEPLVGLAALLFLGPLWAYLRAEVPQVPAQIAQVFVALTLAVWLARGLARREIRIPNPLSKSNRKGKETRFLGKNPVSHLPLLLPLLVFVGAALLSLWDAVELPVYGVPELIKWVQILLLFLFVSDHLTLRRLPWLLGVLLVTGLFQAGVGIWQFGLRGDGPAHFAILGGDFYRAYGTFEQPNPYAGYLGITLPLALGPLAIVVQGKLVNWYVGKLGRRYPVHQSTNLPIYQLLLIGGVALVMLAALGMSWSRGAWLAFGAAVLAMAVALPRRTRWGVLLVIVLVVGGLGLYATGLLPSSIVSRLTGFVQYVRFEDVRGVGINDANYAVIERMAHWQAALEMIRYNLYTGVGFGCYEPAYSRFALINWPIALGHAHNYYLNMAAETGITGLAAYLLLWGAVFWQTWRVTRRADGLLRGVAIGLLGTWTHLSVHHFFDNLYVNNVHLHVGVLLGLLAWLVRFCAFAPPPNLSYNGSGGVL
ncbi:MAG: O-antigen ligase family protein [Chloroflexota bacterium]|nr:O-antigen ligase family protein [Chloroflexota bacterium]